MVKTRIKRIKWKFLSGLLMAMLVFTNILPLNALAADNTEEQVAKLPVLTGLNIIYLDEPEAGKPLDMKAVVYTDQSVCWEIPVIWTDLNGNIVYTAKPGEKYLPVFIFYMPKGYTIGSTGPEGYFQVKLPYHVTQLYGTQGMVFVSDPSLGVTFITYGLQYDTTSTQELVSQAWNAESARKADEAANNLEKIPDPDSPNQSHSSSSNNRNLLPADNEIPEQVRIHCTEKLISMVDTETLAWLVDLIKYRIEPQAANLLLEGFPAFSGADNDELSDEIGLLIYMGDDKTNEGYETEAGSTIAFYMSGIWTDDEDEFHQWNIMCIDASRILSWDTENELWILPDTEEAVVDLDSVVIHELMHGFMYDYTRRIMYDQDENGWFIEGIASSVQNLYQFREDELLRLSSLDPEMEGRNYIYTEQSIINGFLNDQPYFRMKSEGGYADYISGYLATFYLGYMEYSYDHPEDIDSVIDTEGNVDTDKIREGLNSVLYKLHHDNKPLDEIIREASGYSAENETGYSSTADYRRNFILNYETFDQIYDQTQSVNEAVDASVDNDSLDFCIAYLNYLESCSDSEMCANGSILHSEYGQRYKTAIDTNREAESSKYKIVDSGYMFPSSVDLEKAWNTGGVSEPGNFDEIFGDDEEDDQQLAAITVHTDDESKDHPIPDDAEVDTDENIKPEATPDTVSDDSESEISSDETKDFNDPDPADNDLVNDNDPEIADTDVTYFNEPTLTDNDASDNNEPLLTENEDADTGENEISSAETASSDDTDTAEESDTGAENRSDDTENDNGSSSTEDTSSDSEPSEDASM